MWPCLRKAPPANIIARRAWSNIQPALGGGEARDATLSKFQALPFARPTLITFRVLKRNYLGPSPPAPAPPRDPLPEMRRAGKTRKRKPLYKKVAVSLCVPNLAILWKMLIEWFFLFIFTSVLSSWAVAKWKAIKARASDLYLPPYPRQHHLPLLWLPRSTTKILL